MHALLYTKKQQCMCPAHAYAKERFLWQTFFLLLGETLQMSTTRRSDIDIAKGFALFLVVLGHVVTMHHTIFRWIYAFHMPAFFFLSGMTFRPEKYKTCLDYIKKRGRTLILPYFAVTLTALAICTIRPYYHLAIDEYGWKHILTWIFYYGQPQQIYVGQLWFLPALFFAGLYALIWLKLFDKRSLSVRCYALAALVLAGTYIRLADPLIPVMDRLPWKLDSALCAAVFLVAGYYANQEKLLEKMEPYTGFLIPFFAVLSFFFGPKLSTYVNLCDCRYTAPPYYFGLHFPALPRCFLLPAWLPTRLFRAVYFPDSGSFAAAAPCCCFPSRALLCISLWSSFCTRPVWN